MGSIINRPSPGNRSHRQPFFSVNSHGVVWRTLRTCISKGEGVIVVTGEAGSGKSQLLQRLKYLLPDNWDMALIADAAQPQAFFTEALCESIGAEVAGPHEWSMTADEVLDAVANRVEFGRNFLLAIDNAHELTQENLNILNSILLFAVSQAYPVQMLLVGRPELINLLERPPFHLLRNATMASVEISPLTRLEVWEYIRFQTQRILGNIPRMTWPAWLEICAASRGNPQGIDLLLHNILFLNREERSVRLLTGGLVRKGRMAMDPDYHPPPGRGFIPWVAFALPLLVAGYLVGLWFFHAPPRQESAAETFIWRGDLKPATDAPEETPSADHETPQRPPLPPAAEEKRAESVATIAQDKGDDDNTAPLSTPDVAFTKNRPPDTKPLKRTPPQSGNKPL